MAILNVPNIDLSSLDMGGILGKLKEILLVDKVIETLKGYWGMIPDEVFGLYAKYRIPALILAVCLLVLAAFEGYKLFKMALHVAIPAALAIDGYILLAPYVAPYIKNFGVIPEFISIEALVAILCALVGLFISRFAYNAIVMILGGVFGYLLGAEYVWRVIRDFFNTLEFLNTPIAKYIIGGICASIFVLIFILLFKHVFIVGSSFGCLAFAGLLLQKIVAPTADDMLKVSFILVGVAVGVFAVVHQYKEDEKSFEILY